MYMLRCVCMCVYKCVFVCLSTTYLCKLDHFNVYVHAICYVFTMFKKKNLNDHIIKLNIYQIPFCFRWYVYLHTHTYIQHKL